MITIEGQQKMIIEELNTKRRSNSNTNAGEERRKKNK